MKACKEHPVTRNEVGDLFAKDSADAIPVYPVHADEIDRLETLIDKKAANWAMAHKFKAEAGKVLLIPEAATGALASAVLGLDEGGDPFVTGRLPAALTPGLYDLKPHEQLDRRMALTGFALGAYRFTAYVSAPAHNVQLVTARGDDEAAVKRAANASWLARDLVNTPANEMGPDRIEAEASRLAKAHKATIKTIRGDDLLKQNFPMIHAVGRASVTPPRLIDMHWGKKSAPKLTLVGKGVAYDTGGLNIKPGSSMRNMKKDMGGAANVLALAGMIMDAGLNVRLRVLIPAVENAIAGNAFRPGDILQSRKGLTVEIGNTDAEGRLVLADALALADEERPDHIIDMATLTGAARVALGPDLPPLAHAALGTLQDGIALDGCRYVQHHQ
jgi:leucyl aminopeptidase